MRNKVNLKKGERAKKKSKKRQKRTKNFRELKRREKHRKEVDGTELIYEITKIIKQFFPDFYQDIDSASDPRKRKQYGIGAIIFGAVSMFLFKSGSRNNYDNFRKTGKFKKNFKKAFGIALPSMDAVADVMKNMSVDELENIKKAMIKKLLEKKVFHKFRFQGKFLIAIDGTGIATFDHKHCDACLHTTSKNGKTTYYHKVLEAKLVSPNGFVVSICTVWIDNEDTNNGIYDKQGCEQKAFIKLAAKLKKGFPRLPICICADGLYPKNPFFEACEKNGWGWIVTLKDGNLKGLWKKIRLINRNHRKHESEKNNDSYRQDLQWINDIEHNGYLHNWIQCQELKTEKTGKSESTRFVHLTSFKINYENSVALSKSGRLRWKIENEGFDQQKNHGYNIEHKYCRKSYTGLKNFYQSCQIAHIINQLVELSKDFDILKTGKITVMFLWELMRGFLIFGCIKLCKIQYIRDHKFQIQYPV